MFRIYHPKYARIILPAILIAATLLVVGCNNENETESKTVDSTVLRDNTNMSADTIKKDTLKIDTTKGEQTPPPK